MPGANLKSDPMLVFLSAAPSPWGAEHSLRAIASELRRLGRHCQVIVTSEEVQTFLADSFSEPPKLVTGSKNRLTTMLRILRLVGRVPQGSTIVLFSLQLVPLAAFMRLFMRRRFRVILDLHDVPRGFFDRAAVFALSPFLHGTVAISKYVDQSVRLVGRVLVVPRPVDVSAPSTRPGDGQFRVGIVGRLDAEKRIEVGIDAVSELDSRAVLHVYGSHLVSADSYAVNLRRRAADVAPGRVLFHGTQPKTVIYADLDVLLVTNDNEPSGRSVGEAMMAGVAVLVPDRGGASEFFVAGESGLTYRSGDAEDAGRVLREMLQGDVDLSALTAKAHSHVQATRSVEKIGKAYMSALASMEKSGSKS